MSTNAKDFMNENSGAMFPGVKFSNVGDAVVGVVTGTPSVVFTPDIGAKPGDPDTPKLVVIITPTVEQAAKCTVTWSDKDATGKVTDHPLVAGESYSVWLPPRNSRTRAVGEAVVAAEGNPKGNNVPEDGGVLALQYSSDGVAKQVGFNAPKLFIAQYKAPEPKTAVIAASSLI